MKDSCIISPYERGRSKLIYIWKTKQTIITKRVLNNYRYQAKTWINIIELAAANIR